MPPHYKVPRLKDLSRDEVLRIICTIILDEIYFSADESWEAFGSPSLSPRLQIVRDILANSLGANVMQEILNTILEKDVEVEPTIRYLALQLLLVNGVTLLAVGHFPETYYTFILEAIAESAANLERLDFKGIWVRENDKLAFCKAVRRINSVKHLILRFVCDDELLSIIGKHCPKLERLDISGSDGITDEGISKFLENPARSIPGYKSDICATLQIVDFGGPGAQRLSPSIGAKLLLGLPNLKSLGSFEKTGQALDIIYKDNTEIKFNLRYIHDIGTHSQRLSIIVKTCPNLQAMYLDCPGSTSVQHLDMLKHLTEIKLRKVKWNDLNVLLQKCGSRFRNLFLICVWGQVDLMTLGALCPELVRLELHSVSLMCSDTHHPHAFKKVKDILLYNSKISTLCVKLIINQSISVESISLGDCAQLTDAAIISSLMDHSFLKVQSIWFGLAEELTMRTVEALIEHCPELTNLGNLATWNVHPQAIALLRGQLLLTNTELNLHEYGPEEEDENFFMIHID